MREFDKPMVTISQEHFDQLQECKALIELLWRRFGPYDWPEEFRLPKGMTWSDLAKKGETIEGSFYRFTHRMDVLMDFDDSE